MVAMRRVRVVCKFNDDVGPVSGHAVMGVERVREWAENAALGSSSVEDQWGGGLDTSSDHLTSA